MLAEEYTRFCTAIFSSVDDVMKVVSTTNGSRTEIGNEIETEVGIRVVVSEKDAVILSKAARYFECRDNDSALRLMTLASLASPKLKLPKVKLEEYRIAKEKKSKAQYMFTFHSNREPSTPDEKLIWHAFGRWLVLQNFAGGNFIVELNTTTTINTESVVTEGKKSGFHGYTIVQAESIDAALSLAKECPILELGAFIQVSELNFELA